MVTVSWRQLTVRFDYHSTRTFLVANIFLTERRVGSRLFSYRSRRTGETEREGPWRGNRIVNDANAGHQVMLLNPPLASCSMELYLWNTLRLPPLWLFVPSRGMTKNFNPLFPFSSLPSLPTTLIFYVRFYTRFSRQKLNSKINFHIITCNYYVSLWTIEWPEYSCFSWF